jgi:plastocyanin
MIKAYPTIGLLAAIALAACGGGDKAATGAGDSATVAPPGGQRAATGKTIVVEMVTDETGNYFSPKEIEARRGDVIRFTLKAGVHNVNFLPDSNSIKTGLPPVSEMLQLPGQTYDFVVNLQEGDYYFQCDPHAALGMVGKLEVEDED